MIATDPLSLLFIGCFVVGILSLLITAFGGNFGHGHAGGIGHHGGHLHGHASVGHSAHTVSHAHGHNAANASHQQAQENNFSILTILNPMTIILFMFGFGLFGYILHNFTTLAFSVILLLAGVGGVIIAALILLGISRIFRNSEGSTVQDVSDRTGLLGKVSLTIQENSLGEMLYISPGGMRKSIPARSVDGRRLEREQEVVVINYQHGIAEVDTWEHFVNQEEEGGVEGSHSNDLATLRSLLEEPNNNSDYVLRKDQQQE